MKTRNPNLYHPLSTEDAELLEWYMFSRLSTDRTKKKTAIRLIHQIAMKDMDLDELDDWLTQAGIEGFIVLDLLDMITNIRVRNMDLDSDTKRTAPKDKSNDKLLKLLSN